MHMYVGDMDNHYLNLAVYIMEEEAKKLSESAGELRVRLRPADEAAWVAADDECGVGEDDGEVQAGAQDAAVTRTKYI